MTEQYQLMPTLAPDEYAALKADIEKRGVQVPVEYDESGAILDGHHRVMACRELGIREWPRVVRVGMTEEQKTEHVLALNLDRRHLSREQRAELVARLRGQGWSMPRIANRLKIARNTVAADLQDAQIEQPATVTGADGKTYPATRPEPQAKPVSLFNPSAREVEKAQVMIEAAEAEPDKYSGLLDQMDRTGNVHGAYKELRKARKQEAKQAIPDDLPDERYRLIHGDVAQVWRDLEPASIDVIITDPPYPQEYLALYGTLADVAQKVLKPGGSLLAMCGQSYLPEIMAAMGPYMRYHWTLTYMTPGGQSAQLWQRKVNTFWKPVLWYVKGDYAGDWIGDVARSAVNDNDKRFHGWGQSESGMADLIERFSYPGQTILDPFCGGGTTGVVAVQMNRRFIGIDNDVTAIETSRQRLAEVSHA